ncbi:ABC transporter substrate-binding protein [Mesorhizobium sp.]|uniref:ABC transporter substrate-binding protein n=1 Tax=Mesorhizobium sp. TaxID=1871066 RepID=UPI000FE7D313|nr:ABC transporter substrate-binding protein [Mesorhizobium sp.]RWI85992.1 MAG: ABC transporter substrate-binding protein [Mesorhizobium sp.]
MNKLLYLLAGTAIACFSTGYSTAFAADQLVVASFGGAYTASQSKAFIEPYMAEKSAKVLTADYNGGLAELRSQVQSGNGAWDVIDLELQDALRACDDGLIEKIDASQLAPAADGTAAKDDFLPGTLMDCGVGTIMWSNIIAYDKTKFPNGGPKTIADFFDLAKFPGKRGLSNKPNVNLEWALMADGVPNDKIYETLATKDGLDRAFAKLDTIKKDAVFWGAHAQAPQLLADGEVVMTAAANGRIYDAISKEKKPFAIVWDGQIWNLDVWAISKASKNKDAALDFVKFSTTGQRLADMTKYISYGPVRKSSQGLVPEAIRTSLPTYEDNFKTSLANDLEFWADHQDEINQRWATWMAK